MRPLSSSLIIMVSCVVGLLGMELGTRLLSFHSNGRWAGNCHHYVPDLAWDLEPDCHLKAKEVRDAQGRPYVVRYSTNRLGSRLWGDPNSERLKVLIVGDSFTEAHTVSDDKTYYAVLSKNADFEVFAYGVGGYGTLQELMKTQQLLEKGEPNIFVLQFCANDFVNNSIKAEHESIVENQKIRPYLVEDRIQYRPKGIYNYALEHSMLFNHFDAKIQQLRYIAHGGYYTGEKPPPERDVQATRQLLGRFREILPQGTDRYAFSCQGPNEGADAASSYTDFVEVTSNAGFVIIHGVADAAIEHERATGQTVRAADGAHLNELGNAIWGHFPRKLPTATTIIGLKCLHQVSRTVGPTFNHWLHLHHR